MNEISVSILKLRELSLDLVEEKLEADLFEE
jgi:hypothetical protein